MGTFFYYPGRYYPEYCNPYSPYYDPAYCYDYYPSGLAPLPDYGMIPADPPVPGDDAAAGTGIPDGVAIAVPLLSSPDAPEALPVGPGASTAGRGQGSGSS